MIDPQGSITVGLLTFIAIQLYQINCALSDRSEGAQRRGGEAGAGSAPTNGSPRSGDHEVGDSQLAPVRREAANEKS